MSKALSKPKDLEGSLNTGKPAADQNDALSGHEGEATVAGQHLQDVLRLPLKSDANAMLLLNLTCNSHLSCSHHHVGTGSRQSLHTSDAVLEKRIEAAARLVRCQLGPPCRARGPPAGAGRHSDAFHYH